MEQFQTNLSVAPLRGGPVIYGVSTGGWNTHFIIQIISRIEEGDVLTTACVGGIFQRYSRLVVIVLGFDAGG